MAETKETQAPEEAQKMTQEEVVAKINALSTEYEQAAVEVQKKKARMLKIAKILLPLKHNFFSVVVNALQNENKQLREALASAQPKADVKVESMPALEPAAPAPVVEKPTPRENNVAAAE